MLLHPQGGVLNLENFHKGGRMISESTAEKLQIHAQREAGGVLKAASEAHT